MTRLPANQRLEPLLPILVSWRRHSSDWTAGVVKAVAVAEGRALPVHNKIYSPQRPGEQERLNRSCPIASQQN